MILATYNLRSGGMGRTHWTRVLDEFRPDLFLVQETVAPEEHLSPLVHGNLQGRVAWKAVEGRRWGSAVYVGRGEARTIELPDFHGHVVGLELVGNCNFGRKKSRKSLQRPRPVLGEPPQS